MLKNLFREVDNRLRDDTLISCPLNLNTLEGTPFIDSLQWCTNYFVFSLMVYSISEIFAFLFPENKDRNTSLIWIILLFVFLFYVNLNLDFYDGYISDIKNLIII